MTEHQPELDEGGVPWCAREQCQQYDDKRCLLTGQRPDAICEPAVREVTLRLRKVELDAELAEARRDVAAARSQVDAWAVVDKELARVGYPVLVPTADSVIASSQGCVGHGTDVFDAIDALESAIRRKERGE